MKLPGASSSWFSGFCCRCTFPVVVTQSKKEDYFWYCSSKQCFNHDPSISINKDQHELPDQEDPSWVIHGAAQWSEGEPRYCHPNDSHQFIGRFESYDFYFYKNEKDFLRSILMARFGHEDNEMFRWPILAPTKDYYIFNQAKKLMVEKKLIDFEETPPDFEKVFQDNFWDILA